MRRSVALFSVLLLALVGEPGPWHTDASAEVPVCRRGKDQSSVGCGGGTVITTPAVNPPKAPSKPVSSGKKRKSTARYVAYNQIREGPDGKLCVGRVYRQLKPGEDAGLAAADNAGAFNIFATYPPCASTASLGNVSAVAPEVVAIEFWKDIPLPVPEPRIAPGRAITGLPAYLETDGYTEVDFSQDTPLGPMEIRAVGTYEVDWGDGTTTGPFSFEGDAWPDGDIVHTYGRVGDYDVVVTERWVATWRLGSESGVLTELATSATIADFPVQQIQAVVGL